MATRKQVKCINKRGSHLDDHKRIERIGGIESGIRWTREEDKAIANIKNKTEEYYVIVSTREVEVVLATHEGREYLKTKEDSYAPNNLLSLEECPRYTF